jgi:hypothetical protein
LKRSGGVTASAVGTFLGSLLFLLLALSMFSARAFGKSPPGLASFLRTSYLIGAIMMLALFAGGIATGIGLLRGRLWARLSILVFSGALVLIFGFSALTILFTPFPQRGFAPPMAAAVKIGILFFYGLFALLGAGWLYFFNRKTIRQQFEPPASRALSVKVIGGFFLLSAASMLIMVFLPLPANLLGFLIVGLPGHLLNAAFAGIALVTGVGLLRPKPWARNVAIGFCVFYGVSSLLFIALPGYPQRLSASLALLPPEVRAAAAQRPNRSPQMVGVLSMATLLYAVPIWFLVTRRNVFSPNDDLMAPKLL